MADPKQSVVRRLFALSCNICFYEGCEVRLASPTWPKLNADIAHIAGEKQSSARFDGAMSDDERRSFDNLLLLCPNHHRLIDALEVAAHSVDRLMEMKRRHEEHCASAQWWSSEEELDQVVDLAIDALLVSAAVSRSGQPNLVVFVEDDQVRGENRGDVDAIEIVVEPSDDADLLATGDPPSRLSPGATWRMGYHTPSYVSTGQGFVRLTYASDDGRIFTGQFPIQ